jgi:polyvinyl alcohol dehydrogenase (cytochrome)
VQCGAALTTVTVLAAAAVVSATGVATATSTWTGYHADGSRTGDDPSEQPLDPATAAWRAALGGAVYGQPVVADGRIFAATENDRVVALDPRTGAVLWSRTIGTPLSDVTQVAGCGDIDPLGITSTPVIDTATHTLYVVGEIATGDTVHHELVGFDTATGQETVSDDVDPPLPAGEAPAQLLQRAGLALANGRVYVAFGGNDGDCGNYHGWVVGVEEAGAPDAVSFEVASDGEGGAIWESGGAPAVDAAGDLWVTTGNANPDPPEGGPDPKRYTESVVELSPTLVPVGSFKDRVAGGDEDLATGNPVLLPGDEVFSVGKTDIGYVLRRSDLTQVAAIHGVCGSDPDGGPAFDAGRNTMFVPCREGGIQQLDLSDDTVGPKLAGANSAPIIVGGDLWAAQYPSGNLTEYDATTGATVQTLQAGAVPNFASPSAALGLLMIGTDTGVTAFDGPTGLPSLNSTATPTSTAGNTAHGGGSSPVAAAPTGNGDSSGTAVLILVIAVAALAVATALTVLIRRRRARPDGGRPSQS